MADKQNPLQIFSLLFLLVLLFFLLFEDSALSPAYSYEENIEKNYHFDERDSRLNITLIQLNVANEALIHFHFHLYTNSTTNITLYIDPVTEWNLTHFKVKIGEKINVTVTNGNLNLDPDVSARFKLILQRKNTTDEIWAYLFVGIITRGWQKAPWPSVVVVPGILVLLVLLRKRHQEMKKGDAN
ncbi:MAG: hypothetical protein ACFFAE_03315 [Candidatus Hodarchaeota archaeon]